MTTGDVSHFCSKCHRTWVGSPADSDCPWCQVKRLQVKLLSCHRHGCTKDNCRLDGGPEHTMAFKAAEAAAGRNATRNGGEVQ